MLLAELNKPGEGPTVIASLLIAEDEKAFCI